MLASQVSREDSRNLSIISRTTSSLSLIGICFIVVTYVSSHSFHKPINRLVFYASLGNIFTNIATMISSAAVLNPNGGLCQTQGFLVQMFMPADAYWTFAMACNVYLTFYRKFDARRLRKLEPVYFICCYGLPFVPAVVFLGIKSEKDGRMYGDATIWCWISVSWDKFRIALFYGPVWIVLLLTFFIYARAGKDIWNKRKQLRNFVPTPPQPPIYPSQPLRSQFQGQGILQTTQIEVNHENVSPTESVVELAHQSSGPIQYATSTTQAANTFTTKITSNETPTDPNSTSRWSYIEKVEEPGSPPPKIAGARRGSVPRTYTTNDANSAVWSYTKVSLLFFVAMMVTWLPSSANRAYSFFYADQVSFLLEYASALVLPLQGFWNSIIYATTSLQACRDLWADIKERKSPRRSNMADYGDIDREHRGTKRFKSTNRHANQKARDLFIDASSETELQPQVVPRGTSQSSHDQ